MFDKHIYLRLLKTKLHKNIFSVQNINFCHNFLIFVLFLNCHVLL